MWDASESQKTSHIIAVISDLFLQAVLTRRKHSHAVSTEARGYQVLAASTTCGKNFVYSMECVAHILCELKKIIACMLLIFSHFCLHCDLAGRMANA